MGHSNCLVARCTVEFFEVDTKGPRRTYKGCSEAAILAMAGGCPRGLCNGGALPGAQGRIGAGRAEGLALESGKLIS